MSRPFLDLDNGMDNNADSNDELVDTRKPFYAELILEFEELPSVDKAIKSYYEFQASA